MDVRRTCFTPSQYRLIRYGKSAVPHQQCNGVRSASIDADAEIVYWSGMSRVLIFDPVECGSHAAAGGYERDPGLFGRQLRPMRDQSGLQLAATMSQQMVRFVH